VVIEKHNKIFCLFLIILLSFFIQKSYTQVINTIQDKDETLKEYESAFDLESNCILDSVKLNQTNDTLSASQKNDTKFTPNSFNSINIKKFENANLNIDGELNEAVWKKIGKYGNYCEVSPGDNTKPQVETEVMMFYDDENLYFGFICYDDDISKLRKTICERDKMFSDDFCGFFIDTYNESRQAYELFVNPYGIQGDLMWTTPGNEDDTFDMIWYSDAKIYKDKWTIEVAIPFKSIRFPNKKVQDWQVQFLRVRPRENRYQYSLMALSRDDPTLFTKPCKLNGVESVKGGKNIEFLPYLIGNQTGSISDRKNSSSEFKNERIESDFGFNLKYGITSNITADLAVNPDFSQVESDAGVVTVNNPVAYSFSEKRPFFLEGANMFNSPLYVVYTRSINNPFLALKLTGKSCKTEFGYLSTYDKNTSFLVPFAERSDVFSTDRTSLTNIFRIKHTLKGESYLGFILTDREVNNEGPFTMKLLNFDSYKNNKAQFLNVDGYNRAFGFDGKFNFWDNYILDFQVMKYITKEINYPYYNVSGKFDGGKYTEAFDGEYFTGFQNYAILTRSARSWNYNISYRDISPTARRDNGFLQINDFREIATWQGYLFYFDNKTILRVQPQVYTYIRTNYDGTPREQFAQPQVWIQFSKQISLSTGFMVINNEKFGGVFHEGVRRAYINYNINTLKLITLGGYFEMGKYIIRSDNPTVGYGMDIELWSTFKPFNNITMQNNYVYYELSNGYRGEKIYAGYIFRNTTSYNFTKDISLRLITEYNTFSGSLYLNPLASYRPNPFTIFYFGVTDMFNDTDTPNGQPKYILSDRQFFLKIQYLFRM
jgi:hypothetical protein